jgi:GT2 family glycosyltransferase
MVIPPADVDPDPNDEPTSGATGGAAVSDAPVTATGDALAPGAADDLPDDDELDSKWGFERSEPLVGFGAPPVVAVMVTRDPGDWFSEVLRSVGAQDYENLSVLVIDNGSATDPTPVIAEALPTAYVKRFGEDDGFSAAANDALSSVEGAAFLLFLHDDVRLAPDAVTVLVSEAFRANAGIIGPKLVDWDDRSILESVGISVDSYGFASSIADVGELDQSQHDTPREVFAVSDACLLIRADLFGTIGGFSEDIPFFGEDADLCWRAHVAGATVHFAPSAVVAHRGAFEDRRAAENRERLELRHQARMMFTNYEPFRVLRMLPAIVFLSLVDLVGSVVLGRFRRATDVVASWSWNVVRLPSLLRHRSRVKRVRRAHDSDYQPLMRKGSSRIVSLVRPDEGETRLQSAALAGRGYLRELTSRSNRAGAMLGIAVVLLVVLGARDLLLGPLPVVREFFDPGDGAGRLLSEWWNGWRDSGLGEPAIAPAVVPGLGLLGTLLLGSIGMARRLLILGPLLFGALGAWKLLQRSGSTGVRAAALAAYALNPVALNAVAEGRLGALLMYGVAPWMLRRSATAAGLPPFAATGAPAAPMFRSAAGTALLVAVVAAVTPLGAGLLVAGIVVLCIGPAVSGATAAAARLAVHVTLAGVLALLVNLPWLFAAVRAGDHTSLTGLWQGRGATPSAAELVTGDVGPVSVGVLGWGILLAAGYSLVSARSWRFGWAMGAWLTAAASWVAAILLARAGMLAGAGAELILVPAVLALAVSIAMGVFAFELDVVGSDFGVRQLLSGVAALALVVGLVPVAVAAADGRWYAPEGDFRRLLRVVDDGEDFRTLWIGDPDLLPLAGWTLDRTDIAVGLSTGLDPTLTQRHRLDGGPGVEVLRESVGAALGGGTARLGRVLAPMGVRYVVAVDRSAPQPFAGREIPLPDGALAALREQLDLSEIPLNPGLALFEVADPWPLRHRPGAGQWDLSADALTLAELLQSPLPAPEPVLSPGAGPGTRFSGTITGDLPVGQSSNVDPGWELTVNGESSGATPVLGWAQGFAVPGGGSAVLAWNAPVSVRLLQAIQVASVLALVVVSSRRRRVVGTARHRRSRRTEAPIVVVGAHEREGDPA